MALTHGDFEEAIVEFETAWQTLDREDAGGWDSVSIVRTGYEPRVSFLRIKRSLATGSASTYIPSAEGGESSLDEKDEETLNKHQSLSISNDFDITYDVIHHATYDCPALYVDLAASDRARVNADELYDLLVPDAFRQPLLSVGVMGSLSLSDHPISGKPVYWIHPCRTQEAMSAVLESKAGVDGTRYLLAWFGLIGGSIGLNVPVELARILSQKQH